MVSDVVKAKICCFGLFRGHSFAVFCIFSCQEFKSFQSMRANSVSNLMLEKLLPHKKSACGASGASVGIEKSVRNLPHCSRRFNGIQCLQKTKNSKIQPMKSIFESLRMPGR